MKKSLIIKLRFTLLLKKSYANVIGSIIFTAIGYCEYRSLENTLYINREYIQGMFCTSI